MMTRLSRGQLYALVLIQREQKVWITGQAGTKKSFLLKESLKMFKKRWEKVVITTTTGMASL